MKVKDLKRLLKDVDDELDVLVPVDASEFNGLFFSPCNEDTGVGEMGVGEDEDNIVEKAAFVIVPCGFFAEKTGVPPELN